MRTLILIVVVLLLGSSAARAQVAVHDASVTARNTATAVVKEYVLQVQREQHSQLRRMAQRLSLFTNLNKYAMRDVPLWRIHDFESFLYANAYHAALNYGDSTGAGYQTVSLPLFAAGDRLGRLTPAARRTFTPRLATVDLADAATIAATHDSGQVRYNGRRELLAIDVLQRHAVDPSNEQSVTAVLDKISGAVLVAGRQRQARTQLLTGIVEQLLVDNKRARDTEAAGLNMQLLTWRDRHAVNEAFVAGASDALRAWRQP